MVEKWTGTITCLAPLSHNDDVQLGTDTKYRRIKMLTPGGAMDVPIYSGNAFRGILRRTAAADYLRRIGVDKISDRVYYTLFTGGALQKGSTSTKIDVGLKRQIRQLIPFLSLFGTAYVNQVLPGKLNVGIGVPVASETSEFTGVASEVSVWDLLEEIFYTRRDDLEDKQIEDVEQMKYTVECLAPGTVLVHEFLLDAATPIERACFGAVMREFLAESVLGGKSGVGHGKVALDYEPEWPATEAYYAELEARAEQMRGLLKNMETLL